MLKRAIVGQYQEPFAIGIEATRWVNIRDRNEVLQGRLIAVGAELAEDAVGLIEQNNCHLAS